MKQGHTVTHDLDYSKAIRGKYHRRLLDEGANVVILEPDVAKAFGDSATVNEALRSLLALSRSTQRLTKRAAGGKKKAARRGILVHPYQIMGFWTDQDDR